MTVCIHAIENVSQCGMYFTYDVCIYVEGVLLVRFMSCCEAEVRGFNSIFAVNLHEAAFTLCVMEVGIH